MNIEVKFTKKQMAEINRAFTDHCAGAVLAAIDESDVVYEIIETIVWKHIEKNPELVTQHIKLETVANSKQLKAEITEAVECAIESALSRRKK